MGIAVMACIGASATFAFEFGWTRGAAWVAHWTYAVAGVALDLFKSGLPILGATAWHSSKPARSLACWVVFGLTGLSLWCAYGTTATQLAEKFAKPGGRPNRPPPSRSLRARQGRLQGPMPPQREGEERDARADLLLAQQNRAATIKAADRGSGLLRQERSNFSTVISR